MRIKHTRSAENEARRVVHVYCGRYGIINKKLSHARRGSQTRDSADPRGISVPKVPWCHPRAHNEGEGRLPVSRQPALRQEVYPGCSRGTHCITRVPRRGRRGQKRGLGRGGRGRRVQRGAAVAGKEAGSRGCGASESWRGKDMSSLVELPEGAQSPGPRPAQWDPPHLR